MRSEACRPAKGHLAQIDPRVEMFLRREWVRRFSSLSTDEVFGFLG